MELIFENLNIGDEIINLTKRPITKVQLVRYAGASGDFNPLHTDDEVARSSGFDGVVAQGMLVMGIVGQAIMEWIPEKAISKLEIRFNGITKPGDVLKVTGVITNIQIENGNGKVTCNIEATDQNYDLKISGSFEAILPLIQ